MEWDIQGMVLLLTIHQIQLNHYRDLKLIHKEYEGEELLNFFMSDTDMKKIYTIQVIDFCFAVDHIVPKWLNYMKNIVILLIMVDCF